MGPKKTGKKYLKNSPTRREKGKAPASPERRIFAAGKQLR